MPVSPAVWPEDFRLNETHMKTILTALLVTGLLACKKEPPQARGSEERREFFPDQKNALQVVQEQLNAGGSHEKVTRIESISYIDSRKGSYAFVFYQTNLGERNLVIKRDTETTNTSALSYYRCEGEDCQCKVTTVIGDLGDVDIKCSCSSCTMLVN